ncbi:thioredoxin domain-containing protein-like [Palaemon carinicauda]|uniref:thioredoxin domain-containing protein-like n=1 Tax=Palaemon carinicauda TaxID=392227 RepID=UPI0035B5B656
MAKIRASFTLLTAFYLLCQRCPLIWANTLEFMEGQEVKQLINDEKYVVILLSDQKECSEKCGELEETLASIREDVVEALNAWVVRTYAPELSVEYGLKDVNLDNAIVFVRSGVPLLYTGPADNDELMLHFIVTNLESVIHTLNDDTFEHDTQASTGATTGDWLVMFTRSGCDTCNHMRATLEAVAAGLRGRKNVAVVDRDADGGQTTRRFGVKDFPSFVLFRLGRLYRYDLPLLDAPTLVAFATDGFRNARAEDIPHPKTPFDDLTEQIADWLRENPSIVSAVMYASIGLVAVIVMAYVGFFKKSSAAKSEKKQESKKKK